MYLKYYNEIRIDDYQQFHRVWSQTLERIIG
jgi:hypothetical protein